MIDQLPFATRWRQKVDYKPDWQIKCDFVPAELRRNMDHVGRIRVTVSWRALDSLPPHAMRPFSSSHEYDVDTEDDVRAGIFHAIKYCEIHEICEWLRFDGHVYRDPHNPSSGNAPRE